MTGEQAYRDAIQRLPPQASMGLEIALVAINEHDNLEMAASVLRVTADAIEESPEGA